MTSVPTTSGREAACKLQREFVNLCVEAAPPSQSIRDEREAGAPAEFVRLCRHPAACVIFINEQCLYVKTGVVCVQNRILGEYLAGIHPIERDYLIRNKHPIRYSGLHGHINFLHHPHINGEETGGQFCMPEGREQFKDLCADGKLAEAMTFLLDVLHQVDDNKAWAGAHLRDYQFATKPEE